LTVNCMQEWHFLRSSIYMLKNYFRMAWRNLLKSKTYTAINMVGLATGMAVALLIGLWIGDELSFDTYHRNHARLAQVMDTQINNNKKTTSGQLAIPLRNELATKYGDQFKQLALTSQAFPITIIAGEKRIVQTGMFAQAAFPAMLTLKKSAGSLDGLNDPSSMLLSQSFAKALFGNKDPINRVVSLDGRLNVKVTGLYEDLPDNTTLAPVKYLLSWNQYISIGGMGDAQTNWGNHSFYLYALMNDKADVDKTSAAIKDIPGQHLPGSKEEIFLYPMDKWHLYSDFKEGKIAGGRIQFVWLFGIIGAFVLLLACINFMNLSTARSEKRAKEVGIRKALGSLRGQLIGQFLSESVLVALLSGILAIFLVQLSIPFFSGLAGKQMSIPWATPLFWILVLGFTLVTGLVSGSYPAFYLSGFQPIKVLKGIFRTSRFAALPRKVLVVVQFTVSVALIIGTLIVFKQIQYAKNRPAGYSRAGLITIDMHSPNAYKNYEPIRNDLLQKGAIADMAESSSPSTHIGSNYGDIDWRGKDPRSIAMFGMVAITHDFGKTIGWKLARGRDFLRDYPADTGAFILNETAAKLTGFKNPVGETMQWQGKAHVITGIVKDLVMESPYAPVKPTIFFLQYDDWLGFATVKINPQMPVRDALAAIEPIFKKYNPDIPFDYQFTDEAYAKKFSDEERIGQLATFFAVFAILISCLGLFGMASFVAEQRTKEIGVRKVLGASVFSLWGLLSREFVALVVISCLVAVPIAGYFLHQWLQQYEYRTAISAWIFVTAGGGALLITLLTVSYQAIKAAVANPVKSLRTE
jgi:putative ABC transport system permease protein